MKNEEFELIYPTLKVGTEVKIRYYTYNKNDYIDIFGKISDLYGVGMEFHNGGSHFFTIEFLGVYKVHEQFTGRNFPLLPTYQFGNASFCNLYSDRITFIKPASIRAYKIHQLRIKKG